MSYYLDAYEVVRLVLSASDLLLTEIAMVLIIL